MPPDEIKVGDSVVVTRKVMTFFFPQPRHQIESKPERMRRTLRRRLICGHQTAGRDFIAALCVTVGTNLEIASETCAEIFVIAAIKDGSGDSQRLEQISQIVEARRRLFTR